MASMQAGARRGTRRAAPTGTAPRTRSRSPTRAQVPEVAGQNDSDGPMTLTEVSQCRLHELDRVAWKRAVSANHSQANRIEALEHEMLQINDDVAGILDGHLQTFRANERALQGQLKATFADMATAIKAVEHGLLAGVELEKQEFVAVQQGEAALLQELRGKFAQLEVAVGMLHQARVQAEASPIRQSPTQHFTW